ncbi:MAG: serine/threonine-protein kinase [Cyanobacteria bacterium P01_H01_bin.58]
MNALPDFSKYGYCIERELGANRSGGRVTYLARESVDNIQVVIKQFQFARTSSSWATYDAHQREICILQQLDHPGIPRYLTSFQLPDGFCMVQEYKPAIPLAQKTTLTAPEIQDIAIRILHILTYLQQQDPPVIHRDLKPENILVDANLNVFLVDFGFAHIGDSEVGVSSVVKGTLGFMPPEQLFNRKLTDASDLYGLGMTLICLLTHTKSSEIGDLVDISYKVKFRHLVPDINVQWIRWLEKMVESRLVERFPNAQAALDAIPASSILFPKVSLSTSHICLKASRIGEILTHSVKVKNSVSGTSLAGQWKLQVYQGDLPLPDFLPSWLQITPAHIDGNNYECLIEVDTSQLIAEATYSRTLILETNTFPQQYSLSLDVHTAPLPIARYKLSFRTFFYLFTSVLLITYCMIEAALPEAAYYTDMLKILGIGLTAGTLISLQGVAWTLRYAGMNFGAQTTTLISILLSIAILLRIWQGLEELSGSLDIVASGFIPGMMGGWLGGLCFGWLMEKLLRETDSKPFAIATGLTTTLCATSAALSLQTTLVSPLSLLLMTGSLIILLSLVVNQPLNYARRVADYRKRERGLTKP